MKLISWNVNGFRACLQKGFDKFFSEADADIFCIQETKMQPDQADFSPEGYHKYFHSAEKKGYSGTAVFTKKEPVSVTYGINGNHTNEGRVTRHIKDNRKTWTIKISAILSRLFGNAPALNQEHFFCL